MDVHLPPLKSPTDPTDDALEKSLDLLASVLHELGCTSKDISPISYINAIDALRSELDFHHRRADSLGRLEGDLSQRLETVRGEVEMLRTWNTTLIPRSEPTNPDAPEPAQVLERRKESIVRKAKENHKMLDALLSTDPLSIPVTLNELIDQRTTNRSLQRELAEKRARLETFMGLPPNLELARHELRVARLAQEQLFQLRERLLGRMAEGVE